MIEWLENTFPLIIHVMVYLFDFYIYFTCLNNSGLESQK